MKKKSLENQSKDSFFAVGGKYHHIIEEVSELIIQGYRNYSIETLLKEKYGDVFDTDAKIASVINCGFANLSLGIRRDEDQVDAMLIEQTRYLYSLMLKEKNYMGALECLKAAHKFYGKAEKSSIKSEQKIIIEIQKDDITKRLDD